MPKLHRKLMLRVLTALRDSPLRKPITGLLVRIHNCSYHLIAFFASYKGIHPKHKILKYHQFFLEHISAHDDVLDVGCGTGTIAFAIAQKAKRVIGIDTSSKRISHARITHKHSNLTFIKGDAVSYTFNDTFDVIVLSNTLEHIYNRVDLLKKLQTLAPKFLIRVPLLTRDWISVYKKNEGFEYRLDDTHCIEYTLEEFQQEMREAGLRIERYYINFGELYAVCSTLS